MPSLVWHCSSVNTVGAGWVVENSGRMRNSVPEQPGQPAPLSIVNGLVLARLNTPPPGQLRMPGKPLIVANAVASDADVADQSLRLCLDHGFDRAAAREGGLPLLRVNQVV